MGGDRGRAEPNRGRPRRHAGHAQRAAVQRRQVVHRRPRGRPVAADGLRAGPRRTRRAGRVDLGPGVHGRPHRLRRERRRGGLRRSRVLRSEGDQGRRRTPVARRLRRRGDRRSPGAAVEPGPSAGAHRAGGRRRRDPCAAGSRAPARPRARRQHRVHGAEPRRPREGGVPLPAGGEGRRLGQGGKPAAGVLHRSPTRVLSVPGDRRQRPGSLERGRSGLGVLDRAGLLPDQRVQAGRRHERHPGPDPAVSTAPAPGDRPDASPAPGAARRACAGRAGPARHAVPGVREQLHAAPCGGRRDRRPGALDRSSPACCSA